MAALAKELEVTGPGLLPVEGGAPDLANGVVIVSLGLDTVEL